jgi:hypothetical protein
MRNQQLLIKQSFINNFDQLMLFNLVQINTLSSRRQADKIEISMNQLRFVWY